MTKTALILAPHCDDAEFGMGIAIQRMRQRGDRIIVAILSCSDYVRGDGVPVAASDRKREATEALAYLGVDKVEFCGVFTENNGDLVGQVKIVNAIGNLIMDHEPDAIYTCLPSFNQDHRAVFDATVTACRPGTTNASLFAYEYPGNSWGPQPPAFGRLYVSGTQPELARKSEALKMHATQFVGRRVSHGVSPKAAEILAQQRGAECGREAAEIMYLMKETI